MRHIASSFLTVLLLAVPVWAAPPAPNLSVDVAAPAAVPNVYASASYSVTVANIGNRDAAVVQLTIQLPKTGTSPQVYVMGTLGSFDGRCTIGVAGTAAGTRLTCSLGTVARNSSTVVAFNLALPEKTGDLLITASATTTTSPETNPANNADTLIPPLHYNTHAISIGATYTNQHCTGTGLTAYFECTLFPGSTTSHPSQFFGGPFGGTLAVPGEPDYDGAWALSGQTLTFSYHQI